MNLDHIARKVLMSAYLYYHRNAQVLSDAENDKLCLTLFNNWDNIPERYKFLLGNKNDIAYTSHHCKYSRLVEAGALAWLEKETGQKLCPLGYGYAEAPPSSIEELLL